MSKNILLIFLLILLTSCRQDIISPVGKFYKEIENNTIYTFLNDSIIAYNLEIKNNYYWRFLKYSKNKKGIYIKEERRLDTTWVNVDNNKFTMQGNNGKNIFEKINFPAKEVDSINEYIKKAKKYSDKKTDFSREININEVPYFYDNVILQLKSNIKKFDSMRIRIIHIQDYDNNTNVKSNIKIAYVSVEDINRRIEYEGDDLYGVHHFYVFFIPNRENSKKYTIEFSTVSSLNQSVEPMQN